MPTITLSTATKSAVLTALKDQIDAGTGPGYVEIYTAPKPASPETAITTQVLLGTLTLSDPCGSVGSGALTFGAVTPDALADNNGTAAWARFYSSDGVARLDVDASTVGGSGFMQMNTTTVIINGPILINSCVITA